MPKLARRSLGAQEQKIDKMRISLPPHCSILDRIDGELYQVLLCAEFLMRARGSRPEFIEGGVEQEARNLMVKIREGRVDGQARGTIGSEASVFAALAKRFPAPAWALISQIATRS